MLQDALVFLSIKIIFLNLLLLILFAAYVFSATGETRTHTDSRPQDFKSWVSTTSTTVTGVNGIGYVVLNPDDPNYLKWLVHF